MFKSKEDQKVRDELKKFSEIAETNIIKEEEHVEEPVKLIFKTFMILPKKAPKHPEYLSRNLISNRKLKSIRHTSTKADNAIDNFDKSSVIKNKAQK